MIAFGHTAIGAGVGLFGYNLFHSLPLAEGLVLTGTVGVISHYVADFVPHGHLHKYREFRSKITKIIIFDLGLSLLLFTTLTFAKFGLSIQFWYVMFGIGGSQLPDVVDGLIYAGVFKPRGFLRLENDFHSAVHWHGDKEQALRWGFRDIWQVATVLMALLILFWI